MPLFTPSRLSTPIALSLAVFGSILVLIGIVFLAVQHTQLAIAELQAQNLQRAAQSAQRAKYVSAPLRAITLNLADIAAWDSGLASIIALASVQSEAENFFLALAHSTEETPDLGELNASLQELSTSMGTTHTLLTQARLAQQLIPSEQIATLDHLSTILESVTKSIALLMQGNQTWVIMLQNSAELRATGGFTGSYALLRLQDGKIAEIVIEDIYDADGQFLGYVSPPPGIREYTSSGRGLRLPDANWWPDFPKSAQTQLQFFALSDRDTISGLVAVNVDAVAQLLEITGPIWLPDYQLELTPQTLAGALRTDRDDFFPGSIQKKQLISHAFTMIRQKLTTLDAHSQQQLATLLPQLLEEKQVQAYAVDPALQQQFRESKLSGEIGLAAPQARALSNACDCNPAALALIESNVGINKSNTAVSRTVTIDWLPDPGKLTLTIQFSHDGSYQPASSRETSGYVNYQRIITSPFLTVQSIQLDGHVLSSVDADSISTSAGETLTQTGFLVPIPSGQQKTVVIELLANPETSPIDSLLLHAQSGLSPTEYQLRTPAATTQFTLRQDSLVSLK